MRPEVLPAKMRDSRRALLAIAMVIALFDGCCSLARWTRDRMIPREETYHCETTRSVAVMLICATAKVVEDRAAAIAPR